MALKAVDGRGFNFPPGSGSACHRRGGRQRARRGCSPSWPSAGEICERHGATETLARPERGAAGEALGRPAGVSHGPAGPRSPTRSPRTSPSRARASPRSIERLKAMGAGAGAHRGHLRARRRRQPPRQHPLRLGGPAAEGGRGAAPDGGGGHDRVAPSPASMASGSPRGTFWRSSSRLPSWPSSAGSSRSSTLRPAEPGQVSPE